MKEIESQVCPHCGYPAIAQNESHQLPVGTILRGRYQLGKVLGQGGFGITYLAWDKLLRMPVAVKEFYPNGMVFRRSTVSLSVECGTEKAIPHFESSKERFLREASALVDFRDIPQIVDILDFVEENNTAYIVMEFVRGVDLAKYIQRKGGKLSVDETFRILRPVMEALANVHESGIVHRDISPDNIILDPTGGAKILDFGAVRNVDNPNIDKALTKSTEAILKHGFAPMEQYNSRGSLGPWTDEYAICATVWYCLTGTVPPEASIRMTEGIDPDWGSISGLSKERQKALERGFSCRPKDRYSSIYELMQALFPVEIMPESKPTLQLPTLTEHAPIAPHSSNEHASSPKKKYVAWCVALLVILVAIIWVLPNGWYIKDGNYSYYDGLNGKLKNSWLNEDDKYYHFNSDGILQYGFLELDGGTYYFDDTGVMCTDWQTIDGNKYYFGTDGIMITGWKILNNKKYYFGSDGKMYIGLRNIEKDKYYFGTDGIMRTGSQTIGHNRYFFSNDGTMYTGWRHINGINFYYFSTGIMATGWKTINGQTYYFGESGCRYSGWLKSNGSYYCFGSNGVMMTNWHIIDGDRYYFGNDGRMSTGFTRINGSTYYFGSNGIMRTGGHIIDGKWYYFGENGKLQ